MEHERLAELVRLLYVTLTRAKYRCYLAWGPINESETSALAYLIHYRPKTQKIINLAGLKDFMKGLNDHQMEEDIANLVEKSGGAIELMPIPAPASLVYRPPSLETAELTCREFSGDIEKDWRTTSFSAIVSARDYLAEAPDRDKTVDTESYPVESESDRPGKHALSIFDFPYGASAGSCLHDILEHIDFTLENSDDARRLIAEKLAGYGFEDKWTDTIYGVVANVLSAPIMGKGTPSLCPALHLRTGFMRLSSMRHSDVLVREGSAKFFVLTEEERSRIDSPDALRVLDSSLTRVC